MAHIRDRFLTKTFKKRCSFWPVVAVLGPRQCGKSTFLREIALDGKLSTYVSLDHTRERTLAESSPEVFIEQTTQFPLVIDEAHKAPRLFDEIKAYVDKRKRPGLFVLSGSVKFSQKLGIRESLTGRAATLRLDTMTLAETAPTEVNLAAILKYLELGGMPGVCFVRDPDNRENYWDQWLETSCERDLMTFKRRNLSGLLAKRILEQAALLDFPTQSNIANALKVDGRKVGAHLEALSDLFLLTAVAPSASSYGKKAIFLPFDAGLAHHLKADLRRRWQCWFLVEKANQARFMGKDQGGEICHYLTRRGSFIDFILEDTAYLYCGSPSPSRSELMTARAFLAANKKMKVKIVCATDHRAHKLEPGIESVPFTAVVD